MSKFKTKAEQMFNEKIKLAIKARDWNQVTHLFHLYGCHLELIEPIPSKELEHVPADEPTVMEEQQALLDGTIEASEKAMNFTNMFGTVPCSCGGQFNAFGRCSSCGMVD